MNEIKVAENKTLKLTNVLSRLVRPEELGNLPVILTQMQNFMKSNGAQPIGPLVQAVKMGTGPDHVPELYMMQQATQMITQMEPGYHMDAVLRVKGCLYAHFTGPMDHSSLASQKLNIYAYEHEIELTGTTYSIYVNQDSENGVMDVFMETK
jgi:effector-binding domain-containing protein